MLTDKQDYDEIYQKYKNLVMKAAYKYSGNYDIAEDITQSTFLQLYMYIDELKDINIKAWMYTTAKHMALNYNKKAEREVLSETGDDPVILDLEDSAEDTYMERMKDDEQTSLHEEIFAALYKHNPRWYDAIRYVYYGGFQKQLELKKFKLFFLCIMHKEEGEENDKPRVVQSKQKEIM